MASVLPVLVTVIKITLQKMKFFIKDFFSKCDQIRKKFLIENFIFCTVNYASFYFLAVSLLPKIDNHVFNGIINDNKLH